LGSRIRKDNKSHTGPQTKVENNDYHRTPQGNIGYEEVVTRIDSNAGAASGKKDAYGTSSRPNNADDHAIGRGKG
jgi:hypothetical protein